MLPLMHIACLEEPDGMQTSPLWHNSLEEKACLYNSARRKQFPTQAEEMA